MTFDELEHEEERSRKSRKNQTIQQATGAIHIDTSSGEQLMNADID